MGYKNAQEDYVTNLFFIINIEKLKQIFCSAFIAVKYLKNTYPNVKKAYVIGQHGIADELEK